ncbi:MAG: cytochrome c family protein [Litorimonas sp.]
MKFILSLVTPALFLTACGGSETPIADTPEKVAPAKPVVELTPVQRGAKLYARCRACHTLEQDGANKVGPNLWAVYGSKAGVKEGFAYSKAMKASDVTWDETTMDAYLAKPAEYMPGNRMTFIGLKKQEDRDAIQAYLKEKTTP